MVFTTTHKVPKHLGYFCNKNCYQEITKIAQSGHTDWEDQISVSIWKPERKISFVGVYTQFK